MATKLTLFLVHPIYKGLSPVLSHPLVPSIKFFSGEAHIVLDDKTAKEFAVSFPTGVYWEVASAEGAEGIPVAEKPPEDEKLSYSKLVQKFKTDYGLDVTHKKLQGYMKAGTIKPEIVRKSGLDVYLYSTAEVKAAMEGEAGDEK